MRSDVMMIEEFTGRTIDYGSAFYDAVSEAYVQRLLEYRSFRWAPALLDQLDPPPSNLPGNTGDVAIVPSAGGGEDDTAARHKPRSLVLWDQSEQVRMAA